MKMQQHLSWAAVIFVLMCVVMGAKGQDGTYKVTESWRVTVYDPYENQILTRSGTQSGTITVLNGGYQLINTVGADVGALDGSLQYNYYYDQYSVSGQRVLYGIGGQGASLFAVVKLGFFAVEVPLGSSFGFSLFQSDDTYSASGSYLSDLEGAGSAVDGNNERWEISSTAQLNLAGAVAPKITTQPKSQLAQAGTNVVFSVAATGNPAVAYQWQHNGYALFDEGEFSGSASPTLTITGVGPADAGTYSVVVGNIEGSVTSANATLAIGDFLTVRTNVPGWGSVTPNDNGQVLADGQPYTLTASPAKGFGFKNWTDGYGNLLTNGTTLKFIMASDLTLVANFADVTAPKVAITNVPAGLAVSNAAFVVKGTASDNVAVSNVWYKLNTNTWQSANPGPTWSNWTTMTVTLTPGANSLLAQAVDTSGNLSTVVSNSVKYVVSAVLTVQTNVPGWGTISPSYNGAALQIGSPYTLTATAAAGFKFLNWSNNFGLMTNGAVLHFAMQTNLMLTASFADVMAPTLSLTSPSAGQRVSNAVFTVTGKASDNVAVAGVALQVNHAGWFTIPGQTNWSTTVGLTPGTNAVQVYAVDSSGNHSITNTVAFDYVVTNQLGVLLTGLGTLSPNYSNALLEVGRNYSVTATPATGFAFTNWGVTNASGTIGWSTNKPTVQFMMASNLTLTASFWETTKPVVTITSPKAGQKAGVSGWTVAGTTTDNWRVTNVWYEAGGAGWFPAGSTNGYKNWVVTNLSLVAGTNVIKVYGVNLGGNDSQTNSVTVVATNLVVVMSVQPRVVAGTRPAVEVTGTRLTGGGLTFQLHITGAASGVIEVSSNLTDWAAMTNFAGTNASINFTDPGVTNASQRFYRVTGGQGE